LDGKDTRSKAGNKTANINVKNLVSLKLGVRAINQTQKTAHIAFARTLDRCPQPQSGMRHLVNPLPLPFFF